MTWNVLQIILFSSAFDIHQVKTEVEKGSYISGLRDITVSAR